MRTDVDVDDLVAELGMVRTRFKGTLLLVEGDTDDEFFGTFINESDCQIFACGGREFVEAALAKARGAGIAGVLAIVDSDFDRLRPPHAGDPDVISTDGHDAEMIVFASRAFDRVMRRLASNTKIKEFVASRAEGTLRDCLLALAAPLGALRFVSLVDGLNLRFSAVNIDSYVDGRNLAFRLKSLLKAVAQGSGAAASEEEILARVDAILASQPSLLELCCGHDLVAVVARGLRSKLGSVNHAIASSDHIEMLLRFAFDSRDLARTAVHANSKLWEQANPPLTVFAA